MLTRLTYAGLHESIEQRLRLAAGALAAHGICAQASAWDGTRCEVLIADPQDGYGKNVIEIARRRGTLVLELSAAAGDGSTHVHGLTRALHELLMSTSSERKTAPLVTASTDADRSGLVRLATDKTLTGFDVEARLGHTMVWLLPRSGRVVSATLSDQLHARDHLFAKGWTFTKLQGQNRSPSPGDQMGSLDSFLLHAAWGAREHLPAFPHKAVSLSDWPDLGSAASLIEPLTVVRGLLSGPLSGREIAQRHGIEESAVSACLWAFQAGHLLTEHAQPQPSSRPTFGASPTGIFARLAAHFGLVRA